MYLYNNKLVIRIGFYLPRSMAWRRWRFIKLIDEGESLTNAIIGYKGKPYEFFLSIYLIPLLIVIKK